MKPSLQPTEHPFRSNGEPILWCLGIRQMRLMPCPTRHEVVAFFTASQSVLDRQHMADQTRLDAVVVLIGETALIIEDAPPPDVVVEVADLLPASRKPAEAHHAGVHAVTDQ